MEKCALQRSKENVCELFSIRNRQLETLGFKLDEGLHRDSWLPDGTYFHLSNSGFKFYPERNSGLNSGFTYPNFSYVDRENNLWIGTENGLYNYFNLNIEEYNFNLGTPDNVWSVVEDDEGTMWIGSYGNGLYTLDKKGSLRFVDFGHGVIPNAAGSNKLMYMGSTTDGNETVYMTLGYGVAMFKNDKFSGCSVTHGGLYAYYDKQSGQIMYSGMDSISSKRGLYIGIGRDKKFYPFDRGFPICIIRDGSGKIRVGGMRGTAVLVNGQLKTDNVNRPYVGVISMDMDDRKRLWKATEKGVYVELPDEREERVAPLFLTGAYTSLIVYRNKYVVAGGTHGFAIVDITKYGDYANLPVVNVDYEGGFTGLESGQNGIWADKEGYVWLATALNVLKFNPDEIIRTSILKLPDVRISNITFSPDNDSWDTHYFSEGNIAVHSENKFFRIEYIANSISAPKSLRFKYRLKDFQMSGHKWFIPKRQSLPI
ncbi:MAG: two-component regulator propeller domain-containing protein [Paludibacteraceae bacterium]